MSSFNLSMRRYVEAMLAPLPRVVVRLTTSQLKRDHGSSSMWFTKVSHSARTVCHHHREFVIQGSRPNLYSVFLEQDAGHEFFNSQPHIHPHENKTTWLPNLKWIGANQKIHSYSIILVNAQHQPLYIGCKSENIVILKWFRSLLAINGTTKYIANIGCNI
jgi:hypothetical protein